MADPAVHPPPEPGGGATTSGSRRGRTARTGLLVVAAVAVVLVGFLAGLLGRATLGGLLGLPGTETVDRSQPAVLLAIQDLAELRAASGQYSAILDVEQDVPFIPSSLLGQRTLFVALGTVDATVDLGGLDAEAIEVDGESVRIELPAARLGEPRLDPDGSYVYDMDRGLLDRIGDAITGDVPDGQPMYQQATDMLAEAAADSDLADRAEVSTRAVLTSLLESLGFADVTITFDDAPTDPSTGR